MLWGVCENFLFMEVNYEYVIVARLKEIYRANIIASSIIFVGDTQVLVLDKTYHDRSL